MKAALRPSPPTSENGSNWNDLQSSLEGEPDFLALGGHDDVALLRWFPEIDIDWAVLQRRGAHSTTSLFESKIQEFGTQYHSRGDVS